MILVGIIMSSYSTREAAQKLGLTHITLKRYIAAGKIPIPAVTMVGGVRVRLWSDKDIKRIRAILPKIANGRKTRHQRQRKKQTKSKSNANQRDAQVCNHQRA